MISCLDIAADNAVFQAQNDMGAHIITTGTGSGNGGTPVAQVVKDIWDAKYKEQVDKLRELTDKYPPTSEAYKMAANSIRFNTPTVCWSMAVDGTHSGFVGLSVIGTDEKTRATIDSVAYTCVRYLNADNSGYDVVVMVKPNPVLDADTIQKQVEAHYMELGLDIDNVYRRINNALLYSYDKDLLCRPDSTPYVPNLRYTVAGKWGDEEGDTLDEDGPVGMTAREIELERRHRQKKKLQGGKFWDEVTDADVEEAIKGTAYADLVALLRSSMKPALPIAATFPKALVMAGAMMSRPAKPDPNGVQGNPNGFDDEDEPVPCDETDINNYEVKKRGISLAKVRIMTTADGQGCNIYALGVADTGAGKDIGNALTELMAEQGCLIGSGCTAEGLMDALMYKPNGVLELSELKQYITQGNYQSSVTNLLTEVYAKGSFHMENSHRSKGKARDAAYAMPSVYANIQPGVLNRLFQMELVESGFWRRFVVAGWDIVPRRPSCVPPEQSDLLKRNARMALRLFSMVRGDIRVPENYLGDLYMRFYEELKEDPNMLAAAWSLVNQTGPRIALGLAVKNSSVLYPWTPTITDEEWNKTETIIKWFFAHAQRYTSGGMGDKRQQEFEDQITKVRTFIRKAGDRGVTMRDIHRSLGQRKGSSAEMRDACVRELEKRGEVVIRRQSDEGTFVERAMRYVAI